MNIVPELKGLKILKNQIEKRKNEVRKETVSGRPLKDFQKIFNIGRIYKASKQDFPDIDTHTNNMSLEDFKLYVSCYKEIKKEKKREGLKGHIKYKEVLERFISKDENKRSNC